MDATHSISSKRALTNNTPTTIFNVVFTCFSLMALCFDNTKLKPFNRAYCIKKPEALF